MHERRTGAPNAGPDATCARHRAPAGTRTRTATTAQAFRGGATCASRVECVPDSGGVTAASGIPNPPRARRGQTPRQRRRSGRWGRYHTVAGPAEAHTATLICAFLRDPPHRLVEWVPGAIGVALGRPQSRDLAGRQDSGVCPRPERRPPGYFHAGPLGGSPARRRAAADHVRQAPPSSKPVHAAFP